MSRILCVLATLILLSGCGLRPDPRRGEAEAATPSFEGRVTASPVSTRALSKEPEEAPLVVALEPVKREVKKPESPTVRALLPVPTRARPQAKPASPQSLRPAAKPEPKPKLEPEFDSDLDLRLGDPGPEVLRLAEQLTASLSSDEEKAEAIYRWLAENIVYDVEALESGNLQDNDPPTVLRRRKAVCAGYADLFHQLCLASDVESTVVVGRSRSEAHELPAVLRDSPTNHAWNAVKLGGEWRLLDATWGAGHLNEQGRFVHKPSDDWFLVEPSIFIYTHLPQDGEWQLLNQTLTREEFDRQPKMKPAFFKKGLELLHATNYELTGEGEIRFELQSTKGAIVDALVEQNGHRLDSEWVLSTQKHGKAEVRVRVPSAGSYEVHLTVRERGELKSRGVAEFRFLARSGSQAFPQSFLDFKDSACEILHGFQGELRNGRSVRLRLRVPGAQGVFLDNEGQQEKMNRDGDVYHIEINPQAGDLSVVGDFPSREPRYPVLLKYRVK